MTTSPYLLHPVSYYNFCAKFKVQSSRAPAGGGCRGSKPRSRRNTAAINEVWDTDLRKESDAGILY
ncbi:hypothetical protein CFP56_029916 [Quercus suber]|uniref:Uncharacterized protein n=1 Tax=Quercus suber TaxID=58331 RepID=A0AAW0JQA6_QUESU